MKRLLELFLLLFCFNLSAQIGFIESVQRSNFISGADKLCLLEQREADSMFKSVKPIKLNDVFNSQLNGILRFNLPNITEEIEAHVSMIKKYSETNFIWRGDIKNDGRIIGNCIFIQKQNKKFGQIEIFDKILYKIEDLGTNEDNDQILLEIDETKIPHCTCGGDFDVDNEQDTLINNDPVNPESPVYTPNFPETGGGDNENTQESPCGAEISVLFLYTQQLHNSGADIEQSALIGIENLNETLEESQIPNTHVKVSIAGYALWNEYNDNSSIASSILENMRTSTEVLNLRDEFDADLVILIQKSDLIHENKPIGGLAYVNEYAGIDYAFSVCNFSNTANPKLIGHEIGHLFGCRHLDGGHQYANAFEWNEGTISSGFIYRSTLMNTYFNGSILRFSNPNNQFNGYATGTNQRNNSKMIAKNACTVSGFGGRVIGGYEDPSYYSFIVGPTYVYRDQYSAFTWSPLSYGCPGNNECYHWEISWNGGVSFEYFGNTESVTINGLNVPTNLPVIFLKLTSTCFENGLTDVSFYEVKNWSAQNINNDIAIENRVKEKSDLKIYPIPSNQELKVEFSIERPSNVQINLISQNGQKNAVIRKTIADAGLHLFSINIESFINGFYLMELNIGEELLYHPIIISK